jgi:4-hydroxybenzoyl-CoA thioesterase
MKSEIRDRVWWSDVDKMDVMHYAKYLRFTERAEAEFFRTAGFTYDDLHRRFGIWLARVNLDVRYICSARLDDELVCTVELVKLGGSSLHFSFGIKRADGVLLAEVTLVLACLDAATMKAVRIPVALREALSIAA